jgi:uncharacterized PurR-regulated membrane protein YhhQ (DUF165 family)
MLLFFTSAFEADPNFGIPRNEMVYFVIVTLALVNYLLELAVTLLISPIVTKALSSTKMFK